MKTRENYIYIALSLMALLLFSLMNYIKGTAFDFDELFSIAMIKHSFADMWIITARDFHPPLSYFILKVMSWIIEPFSEGSLLPYRITSIVGYFMVILLCIFPVRRLWGFKVSVIAILLFIFMPVSFYVYSNFRMYAWAMPLVLATFVYAYDVWEDNSVTAWCKLTLMSCAAMYIHYYALISTFVVYVILLGFIVFSNKKHLKGLVKNYFISGSILVVLYIPWLYFFVKQISQVKTDYWIGSPALSDIVFALQYYFVPKYYTETYTKLMSSTWLLTVIPIIVGLVFLILILAYIDTKNKSAVYKKLFKTSLAAFSILLVSVLIVMIYTYLVSPVYHIRYLMCYFGLFVLGLSICIGILLEKKRKLERMLLLLFAVFLLCDFGLCFYFNIVRSNFNMSANESENSFNSFLGDIDSFYSDEESFSEMAYLAVLHPNYKYYLVTTDIPESRVIVAPYLANDTISTAPFSTISKVKSLGVSEPFMYMSKLNPSLDSVFSAKYKVVDSLYSGLYRIEPLKFP